MDDHDLYFFGLSGDAADNSNQVERELKIKDLCDTETPQALQMRYPVCFECVNAIIGRFEAKIKGQEAERDLYMKELKKVEAKIDRLNTVDERLLEEELLALEEEEAQLDERMKELEMQEAKNEQEIQSLSRQRQKLQRDEKEFWQDVNNYEKNLQGFQETLTSSEQLIQNLDWRFKKLRNTNFINEVFYISTQDEFGTISGFRMGRLPTNEVKWDEINAAIGQSVYLLCVLAHRFQHKIENYDISLCGAFSRISLKHNKKVTYDLFMPTKEEGFNQGLVCLLDVLNDLQKFVGQNYSFQHMYENPSLLRQSYDFSKVPYF